MLIDNFFIEAGINIAAIVCAGEGESCRPVTTKINLALMRYGNLHTVLHSITTTIVLRLVV